ncbi:hypothetical protein [Sphingobacterium bambusae]|uniref:Uncharacterized protein n=1 Tax=Sphingobacterium bambusae TaxID=662858 RepID=A0ABW6BFN3_9SPHI|nr:hypothetical protein [Sphingobacterium bambusae]WPL47148.1 hypothetical protein SCB77_14365 [Sphingobacterium bambusae]
MEALASPIAQAVNHRYAANYFKRFFRQRFSTKLYTFYLSKNALTFGSIVTAPEIGIDYQDTRVHVVQQDMSGTFDDFLQTRAKRIRMDQQGAVADAGIAFKRHIQERNLYLPFFRIGYKHGLNAGNWQVADAQTTGAPADRVRGFYAQLTAGFGR